jgi:hypothetical protein
MFITTLPHTHPQVFKKRTKPNLLSSGALIRMRKCPIAGLPNNKKKVIVMEDRTPYTRRALQDVFACIHSFLARSSSHHRRDACRPGEAGAQVEDHFLLG